MFAEYIQAALERAQYKVIDNPEPIFGEVPELEGVWATGKTVEECRRELISVIEGWIALRLRMGDSIPPIGSFTINVSTEPMAVVQAGPCLQKRLVEKTGESWGLKVPIGKLRGVYRRRRPGISLRFGR